MGIRNFFKNAFSDMKQSAKEQHKVDRANFAAAKAEAKAQWEEAKTMGRPETMKKIQKEKRDAQIAEANERIAAAQKRIDEAKNKEYGKVGARREGVALLLHSAVILQRFVINRANRNKTLTFV